MLRETLVERLPAPVLSRLRHIGRAAASCGIDAWLVGGVIRDLLLGRGIIDVDIVVAGDVAELAARLGGNLTLHDAFGTATVTLPEGPRFDLARARAETYARPAALPRVRPAGIDEDLARRDFTVNAMALPLLGDGFGELHDPFDGRRDIDLALIRMLHGRSMIDDPTRAFRAVRLGNRLAFEIERGTSRGIAEALEQKAPDRLSAARLRRELELLLVEPGMAGAMRGLARQGLLSALDPRWSRLFRGAPHRLTRLENGTCWYRSLPGKAPCRRWVAALALLLVLPEAPRASRLTMRLKPDRAATRILEQAPAAIPALLERLAGRQGARPSRIHTACRGLAAESLLAAMAAARSPTARRAIATYLESLEGVRADITGNDIVRAGIRPGPEVARGLEAALRAKLDGVAPGPDEQLCEALRALGRA